MVDQEPQTQPIETVARNGKIIVYAFIHKDNGSAKKKIIHCPLLGISFSYPDQISFIEARRHFEDSLVSYLLHLDQRINSGGEVTEIEVGLSMEAFERDTVEHCLLYKKANRRERNYLLRLLPQSDSTAKLNSQVP